MMNKRESVKLDKLTNNISYRIIDDTVYLFQKTINISENEMKMAFERLSPIVLNNNISHINVSASKIEDRKEFYHNFGFSLSYYDVNTLRVLYPDKKNKMDYKCYGIMTRRDFLNKVDIKEDVQERRYGAASSNSGYVSSLLLLFFVILVLCFVCIEGAISLVK